MEADVDLEMRIAQVYQVGRTPTEIEAAFDQLQAELDETIGTLLAETRRLLTTVFFSEGPDTVFAALRPRLIARRDPSLDEEGLPAYRFDVILRGDGETPFFLD